MNILLICPKFPLSFYSLGEFFSGRGKKATNPPLGLLTLAALLPPDWSVRLVDENVREVTWEEFESADSVWIGAMLPQKAAALDMVRTAKRHGRHVVAGGPYASSVPQELFEAGCDVVVSGEAEALVPALLEAVRERQSGLLLKSGERPDLRGTPPPRYDLIDFDDYLSVTIQTTRGCPHNCEFCDIINLNGRIPRTKTPDQVIAELDMLYRLGWRGSVMICDDNFIGNKEFAKNVLRRIIPWANERGEPFSFTAQASIDLATEKELIDLMTEANIGEVFIGVETPDEAVLQSNNKTNNIRNPLRESLKSLIQNGISVQCSFILGFDGEQPGAGERIVAFADEIGLPQVMVNMLVALPGTALWKRLDDAGRLVSMENTQDGLFGLETNFVPQRPFSQVASEYVCALSELYSPANYLERTFNHFMLMRPTRAAIAKANNITLPKKMKRALPKGQQRNDLKLFSLFLLRHGVLESGRMAFWQQLYTLMRKNPSRLRAYVAQCVKCSIYEKFCGRMRSRAQEMGLACQAAVS